MIPELTNLYAGKKVLITGAGGFVGSALSAALAAVPCTLVLQDRSKMSTPTGVAAITTVASDVTDATEWPLLLDGVDVVFHLAAHEHREFQPKLDLEVNAVSVLELLEAARKISPMPKVVLASSNNLVGKISVPAISEGTQDQPLTIYAIHKKQAELYVAAYANLYQLPCVTLRLSNVYGQIPNSERMTRVVLNKIIELGLQTGNLTLFSNKDCVRDFIYIDDVVDAFLRAGVSEKLVDGQPLLVGSNKAVTLEQTITIVADTIEQAGGKRPEIVVNNEYELQPVEYRSYAVDSSRLRELTGWEAKVGLEEGVGKVVEYLKNNK